MTGMDMPNARCQTNAQSVSLANCGRDGPSHPQYSNKTNPGNEPMIFSDPAANAYAENWSGGFHHHHQEQQQFRYPSHSPASFYNPNIPLDYQHGLPPIGEGLSTMPVFAEPYEYGHVNPATLHSSFSSSVGSSIASERMASMTLESRPSQRRTPPMNYAGSHHAPNTGMQGHSWAGDCPATISPKMLRINPSPTPSSASDSDLGASALDQEEACNAPADRSSHMDRKRLPTKPIKIRLLSASPRRESATLKGKGKGRAPQHSQVSGLRLPQVRLPSPDPAPTPKKSSSKRHRVAEKDDKPAETVPSTPIHAVRESQNQFLVESRLAGMSYRDIRRLGKFEEAESTLRGRYRALTKTKEQRVRKPQWDEKDVSFPKLINLK